MPLNPAQLRVHEISEDEIREFIHTPVSLRSDSVTVGPSDFTMHFRIPGDKLIPAVQWILGVDYVDQDLNLRRSTPMFHPVYNWAYAKAINVHGQVYDRDDVEAVVWAFQVTPAAWKQYDVEVAFTYPNFRVYEDDEVTSESQRYVAKFNSPDTKIVTVDNGMVTYDAPGGAFPWNAMPHNATVPVTRRDGAGIRVVWNRVPADFIQASDDDIPQKYMLAKGKVNDAVLFGCPAETLQLMDVNMDDKFPCPLLTEQMGRLSFLYRIEFLFLYVNQLQAQVGVGPAETRRGHNMLLGPRMKYWYARNAASGTPVFEPIDMDKLFTNYTDAYV